MKTYYLSNILFKYSLFDTICFTNVLQTIAVYYIDLTTNL